MQTPKEAILAAYRHQQPEYLTSEEYGIKGFMMPGDRYFGAETEGYDMFGALNWRYQIWTACHLQMFFAE